MELESPEFKEDKFHQSPSRLQSPLENFTDIIVQWKVCKFMHSNCAATTVWIKKGGDAIQRAVREIVAIAARGVHV